jgi:hypothetical protein
MPCAEWRKQGDHLSLPLQSLEKSLTTWSNLGSVERRKSTASSTEVTWDMSRGYLRVLKGQISGYGLFSHNGR